MWKKKYLYNFRSQIAYSFVKYDSSIYFSSILQIWYVKERISRSISESPLDFEITRVYCISILCTNLCELQSCRSIYSICKWGIVYLIHLCLASYKRDIGKRCRPRSDAAERGVWSGSTLFAFSTGISINHGNNKHKSDTPCKGNVPVQIVVVEESTRRKWVKGTLYTW